MADEIDLANDLIDSEVSRALSKMRQTSPIRREGSESCMECGETMPEARKELGFIFCVPCTEERERRKSLFAEG